jgi:phospholipid/cholesterol/gamma-HCH transport system ATP-binding protein
VSVVQNVQALEGAPTAENGQKIEQQMQRPIIQLYNVVKKFGTNQVLKGVSLRIFQGQVTTIIGKSGTGKSVLLKHIIGLLQPDAGEILLYGQAISKMKPWQINRLRARFSYVFQDAALFDSLTVYDNIALPLSEGTSMIDDARRFATGLERELRIEDLLPSDNRNSHRIRISAGYAQAEEDSLIKEVLAKAESKDSSYYEFELN